MKEIVMFTKPFEKRGCYVQIEFDEETMIYELSGIDNTGAELERSSRNYHEVAHLFFYELCWMLNGEKMADTSAQRAMPKGAARILKQSKKIQYD